MGGGDLELNGELCDSCKRASATIFCHADTAFFCMTCDSKIHAANKLALRQARVLVSARSVSRPRRALPARSMQPPYASPATATSTPPTHSPAATSASRWCPSMTSPPAQNPTTLRSESKIQNRDVVVFAI
nr:zinc finger protein CONSTANS-LIKE 4-like [Ipomoea trifida]